MIVTLKSWYQKFKCLMIALNFESDLDHCVDTKKSGCSHLLIIMCFGRGLHSPKALVNMIFYRWKLIF